jgi:hypothetical protein
VVVEEGETVVIEGTIPETPAVKAAVVVGSASQANNHLRRCAGRRTG